MAATNNKVSRKRLVRKASQNHYLKGKNIRNEYKQKLKKISEILRKPENLRTKSDKLFINRNPDIVKISETNTHRSKITKERLLEVEDEPNLLNFKCQQLVDLIQSSKFIVVYTGAGISTAASIPDYRGPNGVWTLLKKGQEMCPQDLSDAEPTLTHMSLALLHRIGKVKHVVSQNCDGLHLRSGLPRSVLSELHGNMYIECCYSCVPHKEYIRLFDVTERTSVRRHSTERCCQICNAQLRDTIVHFGEKGKFSSPYQWKEAVKAARKADLIICLGSSLKVLRKYSSLWCMDKKPQNRPKLAIVNLQWTPKDNLATLKINGKCDDVMLKVVENLSYETPVYKRELDPIFTLHTALKPSELKTTTKKILKVPIQMMKTKLSNKTVKISHKDEKFLKKNCSSNDSMVFVKEPSLKVKEKLTNHKYPVIRNLLGKHDLCADIDSFFPCHGACSNSGLICTKDHFSLNGYEANLNNRFLSKAQHLLKSDSAVRRDRKGNNFDTHSESSFDLDTSDIVHFKTDVFPQLVTINLETADCIKSLSSENKIEYNSQGRDIELRTSLKNSLGLAITNIQEFDVLPQFKVPGFFSSYEYKSTSHCLTNFQTSSEHVANTFVVSNNPFIWNSNFSETNKDIESIVTSNSDDDLRFDNSTVVDSDSLYVSLQAKKVHLDHCYCRDPSQMLCNQKFVTDTTDITEVYHQSLLHSQLISTVKKYLPIVCNLPLDVSSPLVNDVKCSKPLNSTDQHSHVATSQLKNVSSIDNDSSLFKAADISKHFIDGYSLDATDSNIDQDAESTCSKKRKITFTSVPGWYGKGLSIKKRRKLL